MWFFLVLYGTVFFCGVLFRAPLGNGPTNRPTHVKGLLNKTRHSAKGSISKIPHWSPYHLVICYDAKSFFCPVLHRYCFSPSFSFAEHLAWMTDAAAAVFVHTKAENKLRPCCPVCFARKASRKINP